MSTVFGVDELLRYGRNRWKTSPEYTKAYKLWTEDVDRCYSEAFEQSAVFKTYRKRFKNRINSGKDPI